MIPIYILKHEKTTHQNLSFYKCLNCYLCRIWQYPSRSINSFLPLFNISGGILLISYRILFFNSYRILFFNCPTVWGLFEKLVALKLPHWKSSTALGNGVAIPILSFHPSHLWMIYRNVKPFIWNVFCRILYKVRNWKAKA